jgi:hypothetical protein
LLTNENLELKVHLNATPEVCVIVSGSLNEIPRFTSPSIMWTEISFRLPETITQTSGVAFRWTLSEGGAHYSLSSIYRVASHKFYYQTPAGNKHNLLTNEWNGGDRRDKKVVIIGSTRLFLDWENKPDHGFVYEIIIDWFLDYSQRQALSFLYTNPWSGLFSQSRKSPGKWKIGNSGHHLQMNETIRYRVKWRR